MFGGGGGLDSRKMKQMMEQMGIDFEDVDAREVVIRTPEADLVFDDAEVTKMDAQGQTTYQIVGSPEERDSDAGAGGADAADGDDEAAIPDEDVEIVVQRTGADEDAAREALAAEDGDLAAAVDRLE